MISLVASAIVVCLLGWAVHAIRRQIRRRRRIEFLRRRAAVLRGLARQVELEDAEKLSVYESAARALKRQERMDVPRRSEA